MSNIESIGHILIICPQMSSRFYGPLPAWLKHCKKGQWKTCTVLTASQKFTNYVSWLQVWNCFYTSKRNEICFKMFSNMVEIEGTEIELSIGRI